MGNKEAPFPAWVGKSHSEAAMGMRHRSHAHALTSTTCRGRPEGREGLRCTTPASKQRQRDDGGAAPARQGGQRQMDSLQAFLHILSHTGGLTWTQCCENTVAQPSGLPRPCLLPHRQRKPSGSQKAALTRSRSTTTTVSTNRDPRGRQPPSEGRLRQGSNPAASKKAIRQICPHS